MDTINILDVVDEDFVNYKVPSMSIIFPYCNFKCGKENCQNYGINKNTILSVKIDDICLRYKNNLITSAIVCHGFEPFDSFKELYSLIEALRIKHLCNDTIVIYTGYNKGEIQDKIEYIKNTYKNVIIKYGRFIPNHKPHYDNVLGVYLASDNQYAEKIS